MIALIGFLSFVFIVKVADNMLSTARTIFVQRNRCLLASIAITLSNFIAYYVTKEVVVADDYVVMTVASIACGVGCFFAMLINDRFSKDRVYVNVVMSDNKVAMQEFRDFLAEHHITNVATDSYTKDWDKQSITVTAYPETKAKSTLIDEYIAKSDLKFKRIINKQ